MGFCGEIMKTVGVSGVMLGTDYCGGGPVDPKFWENNSVPPVCFGGPFNPKLLGPVGFFRALINE